MNTNRAESVEAYLKEIVEDAKHANEQETIDIPKSIHTGEAFLIWLNH